MRHITLSILLFLLLVFITIECYGDRDEFKSTTLGKKWIWDNPGKDGSYDLKEKPGWLKLTCAAGDHDIWDTRGTGPALVLEAPENYTFETHYTVTMLGNCSVGLVFLSEDALGNKASIGPWAALFSEGAEILWQHAVATTEKNVAVANANDVYAKLEKSGDSWKFYYKAKESDKWTLIVESTYNIGKKHYAGLMSKNWNPGPEISTYFDYVETSWGFASVEPGSKLAVTWGAIK